MEEVGIGESIGGKPPILLSLIPDSRFMIGLNLAQEQFFGAIVNLRGEVKESIRIHIGDTKGDTAIDFVYQIISELINKEYRPVVGIGVGTPGLIDTRIGTVINSVNLDWRDLPLGKVLHRKYKLPVLVLNDSQATAVGEFVYGENKNKSPNRVVLTINKGVGAGILINRKLFQGDGGGAGEIGHVVVKENGKPCRCGKYGCLETVSSTRAVLEEMHMESLTDVEKAFSAGDKEAKRVIKDAAHYLGLALANMIGTLNINEITLTGGMTRFGDAWLEEIKQTMDASVFSLLSENVSIKIGALGYQACILGASVSLIMNDYNYLFLKGNKHNAII